MQQPQNQASSAIASPISKQIAEDQVYSSDDYIDEDSGDILNDMKKVQKISEDLKTPEKMYVAHFALFDKIENNL